MAKTLWAVLFETQPMQLVGAFSYGDALLMASRIEHDEMYTVEPATKYHIEQVLAAGGTVPELPSKDKLPKVGDHATMYYPSDTYPGVVLEVDEKRRWIKIANVDVAGKLPVTEMRGPFPYYRVKLTDEQVKEGTQKDYTYTVKWYDKLGEWGSGQNVPVRFGDAWYTTDFSN